MTALRLPDQFSPGALGATAATPTCCCCCCCCLASALTTPIVLHGGLLRDLTAAEPERPRRRLAAPALSAMIWIASLLTTALIAFRLDLPENTLRIVIAAIVIGAAAAVAMIAAFAGSRRPAMQAVRLLLGAVAVAAEFVVGAYLILVGFYLVVGPVITVFCVAVALARYKR